MTKTDTCTSASAAHPSCGYRAASYRFPSCFSFLPTRKMGTSYHREFNLSMDLVDNYCIAIVFSFIGLKTGLKRYSGKPGTIHDLYRMSIEYINISCYHTERSAKNATMGAPFSNGLEPVSCRMRESSPGFYMEEPSRKGMKSGSSVRNNPSEHWIKMKPLSKGKESF